MAEAGRAVSVLIWTTTPWTIPSNLAVAFHPEFEYGAYVASGGGVAPESAPVVIVAKDLAGGGRRQDRTHAGRADRSGARSRDRAPRVPPSLVCARLARRARRLRHARRGHGCRAHGARPRRGRLSHRREVRPRDLRSARSGRTLPRIRRAVCGTAGARGESEHRSGARRARPPVASRGLRPLVSALLALPQPGDLPRDVAVVHRDGRQRSAHAGARGDRPDALDPVVGPRSDLQHDREPARLVHLAPARLGCADSRRSTARRADSRS